MDRQTQSIEYILQKIYNWKISYVNIDDRCGEHKTHHPQSSCDLYLCMSVSVYCNMSFAQVRQWLPFGWLVRL